MWASVSPAALLQTNTNYSQEKHRCEYLHSKLAHIKRLIAELSSGKPPVAAVGRKDSGTVVLGGMEYNYGSIQHLLGTNCGP